MFLRIVVAVGMIHCFTNCVEFYILICILSLCQSHEDYAAESNWDVDPQINNAQNEESDYAEAAWYKPQDHYDYSYEEQFQHKKVPRNLEVKKDLWSADLVIDKSLIPKSIGGHWEKKWASKSRKYRSSDLMPLHHHRYPKRSHIDAPVYRSDEKHYGAGDYFSDDGQLLKEGLKHDRSTYLTNKDSENLDNRNKPNKRITRDRDDLFPDYFNTDELTGKAYSDSTGLLIYQHILYLGNKGQIACAPLPKKLSKTPFLVWSHYGSEIKDLRLSANSFGDLVFSNVDITDSGDYTCEIGGEDVETSTVRHHITVLGIPFVKVVKVFEFTAKDCNIENENIFKAQIKELLQKHICLNNDCTIEEPRTVCRSSEGKYSIYVYIAFTVKVELQISCDHICVKRKMEEIIRKNSQLLKSLIISNGVIKIPDEAFAYTPTALLSDSVTYECPKKTLYTDEFCFPCFPGNYVNGSKCMACPKSMFSSTYNSNKCTACPFGRVTEKEKATSIEACKGAGFDITVSGLFLFMLPLLIICLFIWIIWIGYWRRQHIKFNLPPEDLPHYCPCCVPFMNMCFPVKKFEFNVTNQKQADNSEMPDKILAEKYQSQEALLQANTDVSIVPYSEIYTASPTPSPTAPFPPVTPPFQIAKTNDPVTSRAPWNYNEHNMRSINPQFLSQKNFSTIHVKASKNNPAVSRSIPSFVNSNSFPSDKHAIKDEIKAYPENNQLRSFTANY